MPDMPDGPPFCIEYFHYWVCNRTDVSIGCSVPESCTGSSECPNDKPKPAKLNATYTRHGKIRPDSNETACELANPWDNGCCTNRPSECPHSCPRQDLTNSIVSYILTYSFPPIVNPTFSTNPIRASSAQGSVISSSVSSSVPTTTATGQSALHTDTPASSSTDTPSSGFTNTPSPKPTDTPAPRSNSTAIAGGVAGGIVGLALLVGLLTIYGRRWNARPQRSVQGRSPVLGSAQPRSLLPDNAELEEIKQGPTPTSLPLRPPSPPSSPLLSPLPPPPAYAPYIPHGNEPNRSPDHFHSSSGSPYVPYDLPSPESPPSPPPLKRRLSEHSASNYSDEQSVSPISSHYQHRPFDN